MFRNEDGEEETRKVLEEKLNSIDESIKEAEEDRKKWLNCVKA